MLGSICYFTFYQKPCVPQYYIQPFPRMRLHVARRVSRGLLTYHTLLLSTTPSPAETKNPTHVHVLEIPNEVHVQLHASPKENSNAPTVDVEIANSTDKDFTRLRRRLRNRTLFQTLNHLPSSLSQHSTLKDSTPKVNERKYNNT